MVFNRQALAEVELRPLRALCRKLRLALSLGRKRFDVTLVDDPQIEGLNRTFRGKDTATDVLSFPWNESPEAAASADECGAGFPGFLGDIVISVEAARRNAKAEGHSLQTEIQQLILHGVLHLTGHDHENDCGEMNGIETALRRQLEIDD